MKSPVGRLVILGLVAALGLFVVWRLLYQPSDSFADDPAVRAEILQTKAQQTGALSEEEFEELYRIAKSSDDPTVLVFAAPAFLHIRSLSDTQRMLVRGLALERLNDTTNPMSQHFAVTLIGHFGEKPDVQLVLPYLSHTDPLIRRDAVRAVGNLGNSKLAPRIRPLQKDPNEEVRRTASEVLRK